MVCFVVVCLAVVFTTLTLMGAVAVLSQMKKSVKDGELSQNGEGQVKLHM